MRIAAAICLLLPLTLPAQEEKPVIPSVHESIVVRADPIDVSIDHRNGEAFDKTLFSRDDQVFHLLSAGINAGQHEGGGKSLEIRRFGYNLDHGGVSGGLKVLVDDVQQNLSTQGHGQGYLGNLKSLTPELIKEVNLINGPFSAEYGDFSGLGVVHILLRESLPDQWTFRIQGGSFGTARGFASYSPNLINADAFIAYEGSGSDGPFFHPLGYRRDNVTGNYTLRRTDRRQIGFKLNAGRNTSDSSGQIPLDEVAAGRLSPFGFIDPTNGIKAWNGTTAAYLRQEDSHGGVWKADAFLSRSLFDLFSNFTFFLADPINGDAIQQHDSRLQQGANLQYLRPHRFLGVLGNLSTGGNFHANQINVSLYPRRGRVPTGVTTRDHANITNGAGYVQENLSFWNGKLLLGGGLRFDAFRFTLTEGGTQSAGRWQPKANAAFTPSHRLPLTLFANYGRGISTADARTVVQFPDKERVATTDFYQSGLAYRLSRVSLSASGFWIDRSNEQVYIPDDGTTEFKGPSRSYGFETKASADLTRKVSVNAGITKVSNAYYRDLAGRVYVDSAPHFVADAGLTVTSWRQWSGSLRMRAINHYRLDGEDPSITASGHTVFDFFLSRRLNRAVEVSFAVDNLLNRSYWETQNYFESRLQGQDPLSRIHATPGYKRTLIAGLTLRLGRK